MFDLFRNVALLLSLRDIISRMDNNNSPAHAATLPRPCPTDPAFRSASESVYGIVYCDSALVSLSRGDVLISVDGITAHYRLPESCEVLSVVLRELFEADDLAADAASGWVRLTVDGNRTILAARFVGQREQITAVPA